MDIIDVGRNEVKDALAEKIQKAFQDFLLQFEVDGVAIYVAETEALVQPERNTLVVDIQHVEIHDQNLATTIQTEFYRLYPYLCFAAKNCTQDHRQIPAKKDIYVGFTNFPTRHKVRELSSAKIGSLLKISGQVVRAHPVHPELVQGTFTCMDCNSLITNLRQQFKYTQPSKCSNPMCNNRSRFQLDVYKSVFVDFQKVRVQETQAELPHGAIPRSVEVILRAECVEYAQPGDRCDFTGTLIVVPDVSQLNMPGAKAESSSRHKNVDGFDGDGLRGLKSLGVRDLTYKMAFLACSVAPTNPRFGGRQQNQEENMTPEKLKETMTPMEWKKIFEMTEDKRLFDNVVSSLFPAIYGCDEIKRGILLMLFGGVPKITTEKTTLRGDINVCIVGDPSTAKSQLLKIVEEFSARAVYTSGKASSAAGLTAGVVRDEESGEFVIEAGALMLADNGVCCIDEFDKMDQHDQVSIHEAMEQQTISITKAGVKASLNARTSILAAANPIGGRYDKTKSLRQNVNLSAPILSRFDLFFVLVDSCDEVVDHAIAQRIVELHLARQEVFERVYSVEDIQRYIAFARHFKPKITKEAEDHLVEEYKKLRLREGSGAASASWRITVRQLESMIRLSEAMARLQCCDEVQPKHVKAAFALLNKSIIRVERPEINFDDENDRPASADAADDDAMETTAATTGDVEQPPSQIVKLTVTSEDYDRISGLLLIHLRHDESRKEMSEEESGMRQSELVSWYMGEFHGDVESMHEALHHKRVVEKIIERMVNHDNSIIELPEPDSSFGTLAKRKRGEEDAVEKDERDPLLVVHPNFVVDSL